jgi:hypothetical protein
MYPRARLMPVTGPLSRKNSYRATTAHGTLTAQTASLRHRSQALLDRTRTPAPTWEIWRKSEAELKGIKNKKVRDFYENQVLRPYSEG